MASSPTKSADVPAEGNVYASRTELLEWVNGLLQLQLSRLEQFTSGAVFCQLLDAYFKDVVPMHKVNYYASNEYEALVNYKVLQQGFTAIGLTRDIHVSKLSRGSRVELLELLQYLYKYLLKLKAQEGYSARDRRAITVQGGTDHLPSWASTSQVIARNGMNKSSGNWNTLIEPQQTGRRQLHISGSFNASSKPPTTPRGSTTGRPSTASRASSQQTADKEDRQSSTSGSRKSSNPSRIPSASPRDRELAAATATAAAAAAKATIADAAAPAVAAAPAATEPSPTAAAVPAAAPAARASPTSRLMDERAEDEAGIAVFQVVEHEEEAATARAAIDDPGSTTRLVIPEATINSSMLRPLSPGSQLHLEACLTTVAEAIEVLSKTCSSMGQIASSLATYSNSYVYKGKIRSLQDAASTTAGHAALLLGDVVAVCGRKASGSADGILGQAEKLQQDLVAIQGQLDSAIEQLQLGAAAQASCSESAPVNPQLTQQQKQLASTAALDNCLRSIGATYAALLGRSYKESAATAAQFLLDASAISKGWSEAAAAESSAAAGAVLGNAIGAGAVATKVLKLGDCAMKRLRNGDVYKGRYHGCRKNGDGSYFFTNGDVYEGDFKDDRMSGSGVYSFSPEGRYVGDWFNAAYEGHGSETFSRGSTYHGQYAGGLRTGWGVCRFYNGDYYEGYWGLGVRDGCGMQQCMDDSNFVGEYKKGKRHGYGVYSFPNGDQYLGEYVDDIPQGSGIYLFASGQKYQGNWDKGKKHGWSIYTVETGQQWAGSWVEGKPQWVHPLTQQDGQHEAQDAPAEVKDNLSSAFAACKNAQEAGKLALAKLTGHWDSAGEVQQNLTGALSGATQASARAQAARQRAQVLAARLDAAAMLVQSSRSAQMKLVTSQLNSVKLVSDGGSKRADSVDQQGNAIAG